MEQDVIKFRELFGLLPPNVQAKEVYRLLRIIKGKPALVAEPLAELDRKYKFQSVEHMVAWLRSGEYPKANASNIYKAIRKERGSAYGYIVSFEKEKGGN